MSKGDSAIYSASCSSDLPQTPSSSCATSVSSMKRAEEKKSGSSFFRIKPRKVMANFVDLISSSSSSSSRHSKKQAAQQSRASPHHQVLYFWIFDKCVELVILSNLSLNFIKCVFLDPISKQCKRPKIKFYYNWFQDLSMKKNLAKTFRTGILNLCSQIDHNCTRPQTTRFRLAAQ